jgi:hypothetical protein
MPARLPPHCGKIKFKTVTFFRSRKVTVNFPRFTSNSPQLHHKKPSRKTRFSAKTPAKTPFHHEIKNAQLD